MVTLQQEAPGFKPGGEGLSVWKLYVLFPICFSIEMAFSGDQSGANQPIPETTQNNRVIRVIPQKHDPYNTYMQQKVGTFCLVDRISVVTLRLALNPVSLESLFTSLPIYICK